MRRIFVILLAILCVGQAACAAEGGQKKGPAGAPPNAVDMPFLVAPANRGDTLIGFHYISYRLITPTPAEVADVRNKIAIIQDAYVRDVYKTAVGMANDQSQVDVHVLHDRMVAIAKRIVGNRKVADLVFMDMKFSPLHPKPGGGLFVPSTGGAGSAAPGAQNGTKSGQNGGRDAGGASANSPAH